jgi:hypothetical protein
MLVLSHALNFWARSLKREIWLLRIRLPLP